MITVFLYGKLAEMFGSSYELAISSPSEAVRALECNNPGRFLKELAQGQYNVLRGCLDEKCSDSLETLEFMQDADIHFIPVLEGSKSGGQIALMGIAIIGVAFGGAYLMGLNAAAGVTGMAAVESGMGMSFMGIGWSSLSMFGAAMVLGGVAQMLSPTPQLGGGSNSAQSRNSFIFSGGENIGTQGGPVPVIYGEVVTGSTVVSQSITIDDVNIPDVDPDALEVYTFAKPTLISLNLGGLIK